MQIVTFSTLQMPPHTHGKYATFWAHSASGGPRCWDFNLGLKEQWGQKGEKMRGRRVFLITLSSKLNNKAHTPHPASHVPHHSHPPPQQLPLPRASIHAQLSPSREAGRCYYFFFFLSSPCIKIWVMTFFGIWRRISIYQILQRFKLQRRLFDI